MCLIQAQRKPEVVQDLVGFAVSSRSSLIKPLHPNQSLEPTPESVVALRGQPLGGAG